MNSAGEKTVSRWKIVDGAICSKCGKRQYMHDHEASAADELKQCYCGAVGQRRFYNRFPEYANMRPRPRMYRSQQQRGAW